MHLFLLHFVGKTRCSRQTLNRAMGDEMRWIHLGSTRCTPSLAQIGGLLLETSLPIWQQRFFKKETCGTIRTQKVRDAEEVKQQQNYLPRHPEYTENFAPNTIHNPEIECFPKNLKMFISVSRV